MNNNNELLYNFCLDTENAENNFKLAEWYEKQGHTAPAHTYYLRAAERSLEDKWLAYKALIRAASCYKSQGSRDATEKVLLENALTLFPERPDAYYFLSLLYERRRDWQNCYIYSCLGLQKYDEETPILFAGKYALIFQKAISAWSWGRSKEAKELFLDLKMNYKLDEKHRAALDKNLKDLKIAYPSLETKQTEKECIDDENITVVIQGPYREYTNEVVKSYLQLPFVKNIIISCWEDDDVYPEDELTKVERVEVIRNKKPDVFGTDNRNLQIVSSINGLRLSKTKVSVKVRSDQIFSLNSLVQMNEYYRKNGGKNKLFVNGLFPSLLFHPCDHLVWGETSDLIRFYDIPLELNGLTSRIKIGKENLHKYYSHFVRTETYLGAHYLANFHEEINLMLLQPEKFLHDNSASWNTSYELSNLITRQYFKSFPRHNMEMYWAGKNMNYPFEEQKRIYNQCWSEDGY